MSETDKMIRLAANELASALTAGGREYFVHVSEIEVTRMESTHREFAYNVSVDETCTRRIAP